MRELHKELAEAERALDDRRHALQKRIEKLGAEIDAKVYALYGLTEEERRVVEGSGSPSPRPSPNGSGAGGEGEMPA